MWMLNGHVTRPAIFFFSFPPFSSEFWRGPLTRQRRVTSNTLTNFFLCSVCWAYQFPSTIIFFSPKPPATCGPCPLPMVEYRPFFPEDFSFFPCTRELFILLAVATWAFIGVGWCLFFFFIWTVSLFFPQSEFVGRCSWARKFFLWWRADFCPFPERLGKSLWFFSI